MSGGGYGGQSNGFGGFGAGGYGNSPYGQQKSYGNPYGGQQFGGQQFGGGNPWMRQPFPNKMGGNMQGGDWNNQYIQQRNAATGQNVMSQPFTMNDPSTSVEGMPPQHSGTVLGPGTDSITTYDNSAPPGSATGNNPGTWQPSNTMNPYGNASGNSGQGYDGAPKGGWFGGPPMATGQAAYDQWMGMINNNNRAIQGQPAPFGRYPGGQPMGDPNWNRGDWRQQMYQPNAQFPTIGK